MTDTEATLAKIVDLVEYRLGQKITDFDDPALALDCILSHETAAGRIPRYGAHWLSQVDREKLPGKVRDPRFSNVVQPVLLMEFLVRSEHCRSGQEFTSLAVVALIEASHQIEKLQKQLIDITSRSAAPMFMPSNGA